ncbi:MAG TPA: V-type ATP synthase subunit E family protein [Synergistaceae bacterium]|nr:V-type ATP synthase subunit E family protein [Synergistaceae bacterium]
MTEAYGEKLNDLRSHILDRARMEGQVLLDGAAREVASWQKEEGTRLDWEIEILLREARSRSEELRRRQVAASEREKARERLRAQNKLLQQAAKLLQEALGALRTRPDYGDILRGVALEALEELRGVTAVRVRLAAPDGALGDTLARELGAWDPTVTVTFDPAPAPMTGGVWLASADGRRQATADWSQKTQELSETLADRLLALL